MLRTDQKNISEMFASLRGLSDEEREIRLSEIGTVNPAYADELRELLEARENAGDLFNNPPYLPPIYDDEKNLFSPGDIVHEKYEVVDFVYRGGQGEVYQIRRTDDSSRLEIMKFLRPSHFIDQTHIDRFKTEAKVLLKLKDSGIPVIHDWGYDAERSLYWIRMEYIDGETLWQRLQRDLDWPLALKIAGDVAAALQVAHENKIFHRDIKPQNIMISHGDHVKVLDFGLAKLSELESTTRGLALTKTGAYMGTPDYMSPEQKRSAKGIDHRTDIWSLGVVLFEMILGRTPTGDDHLNLSKVQLPSGVPVSVRLVLEKSLKSDRDYRYQSAKEFEDALRYLLLETTPLPLPRSLESPLSLFTPDEITAMPIDMNQIKPFWPLDLGKAWGLDRGCFLGIAVNPCRISLVDELRGLEALLGEAQKNKADATPFPARLWLRVRNDIFDRARHEIKNIDDLLGEKDNGQFASIMHLPIAVGFILTVDEKIPASSAESVSQVCRFIFSACLSHGLQTAMVVDLRWDNKEARDSAQAIIIAAVSEFCEEYRMQIRTESFLIDRRPFKSVAPVSSSFDLFRCFRELLRIAGPETIIERMQAAGISRADVNSVIIEANECDPDAETEYFSSRASLNDNIPLQSADAVAAFLHLVRDHLYQKLGDVIEAMASSGQFELCRQSLVFAASSDRLMDRWVSGMIADGSDLQLDSLFKAEPGQLLNEQFVLACLRKYSDGADGTKQSVWLTKARRLADEPLKKLIDYFSRRITQSDLLSNTTMRDRWLYARCGVSLDDLYTALGKRLADDPQLWKCLLTTAIDRRQIGLIVNLDRDARAVWGLCLAEEWQHILDDRNLAGKILDRRGGRILSFVN